MEISHLAFEADTLFMAKNWMYLIWVCPGGVFLNDGVSIWNYKTKGIRDGNKEAVYHFF